MCLPSRKVDNSITKGLLWYKQASDNGSQAAQTELGIYLLTNSPGDSNDGIALLQKAAIQNHMWARFCLGQIHLRGGEREKAVESFTIAKEICKDAREMLSAMSHCTCNRPGEPRLMCSRCKRVFYCSSACQKNGWKKHKTECRAGDIFVPRFPEDLDLLRCD